MQRLADTTAESENSVKRMHAIGLCELAAVGKRSGGDVVANIHAGRRPAEPQNAAPVASPEADAHAAQLFQAGQAALNRGSLDEAERDFRRVLAADPQIGGAYVNLGVVYMRRKQWNKALEMLRQAERLLPRVPGIRLNIGLAYYRQNEFLKAIPSFEFALRDQPDSLQARHLLGLCYFFTERWADAANTLAPLWAQESGHLSYLYVLSIAAHRATAKENWTRKPRRNSSRPARARLNSICSWAKRI